MRKFDILIVLFALILFAVIYGIGKKQGMPQRLKIETDQSQDVQTKLIILEGDNVLDEVDLKGKFIFILKPEGVFYSDTSQPGFFKADYSNLSALGKSHQEIIRKRVKI